MKLVRSVSVPVLFILLALFPIFAYASVEEEINKQYPLERDGEVQLKNISGKIIVTTWERNEVKIRARKTASSQKVLERIDIKIDADESSININTGYDKSFNINPFSIFSYENWSVDYEMTVPDMADISLGSVSGNIRVNSVGGALEVDSVSGEIKVVSVGKNVRAKSVSGGIYLEGIAGDTHAETVSGRISANEIRGEVFVKTVSGNIEIDSGSEVSSAKVDTVSGSISARYRLDKDGSHNYNTVSGTIKIELPADSGFDFTAKTFSGSIDSAFDVTVSGRIEKNNIRGVVRDGGPGVYLNTFSGSIRLEKR